MPGSVRVYELAKQLNMSNADLMDVLRDLGEPVKSHSSTLTAETARLVEEMVATPAAGNGDGGAVAPTPVAQKTLNVFPGMTVRELAEAVGLPASDIQKRLIGMRIMAGVNQPLDLDVTTRLAEQLNYAVQVGVRKAPTVTHATTGAPRRGGAIQRPPVVTIMGHVDHGKTTLLDAIRKTKVTDTEFGGITQHIGAYQVEIDGRKITFLDTPGHAAFTAMRARGAQVTDIVILVVAADDGIMPQTVEAINHAKAAGVPIIVAVNKIDREDANPDRVKTQLTEYELLAEDYGGDTMMVNVSAKQGTNLDELLTAILVKAEELNLRSDTASEVEGAVVEARLEKGRGAVATVLVQKGILVNGDSIVVGGTFGKVKAMLDDHGQKIQKAGPSTPVEVLGLNGVPVAGDQFHVVKDDRTARQMASESEAQTRATRIANTHRQTLQDLRRQVLEGETKSLNVIIKADVHGSLEAVRQSLEQLSDDEVRIDVVASAVGNISGSDILLATASNAIVIGFNVTVDNDARTVAQDESIDVRVYNIIYELIDEVRKAMLGQLEPVFEEIVLGKAECRAVFRTPRGPVAGSYVVEGKIARNADARVIRDKEVVWTGRLASLRHVKDDVREVLTGFECGILMDGFHDAQVGDVIVSYEMREVPRY